MNITTHTVVKNEENWIWYALESVRPFVSEMLVIDDDSTDKTVEIIKSIKDPKIKLFEQKLALPADHTNARNELIGKTTTDWFLLVDGDEVWNGKTLKKFLSFLEAQPRTVQGVVMRTRNCIGDVFHYLPEDAGKYELAGHKGHLTVRAYRKLPNRKWKGNYPLEKYCNDHLTFFDGYYWHMTHLQRSSSKTMLKGWRKEKLELGIKAKSTDQFPEVFYANRPEIVPSPWNKMPISKKILAGLVTPVKKIRRAITK